MNTPSKVLLFALLASLLAGCGSVVKVRTTAQRMPDINNPAGFAPLPEADVRIIEYKAGTVERGDPPNCVRLGAVYANWGLGDRLDFTPGVRPPDEKLVAQLKERAAMIGANAIAWPATGIPELNYAFAYRCDAI